MTRNTFLDKTGLIELLKALESRYKSIHKVRIDAGLKLCKVSTNNNKELHINPFEQGKYYYTTDEVDALYLNNYEIKDPSIMGESMVQFSTSKDGISKDSSINLGNITSNSKTNWVWVGDNSTLKKDSNYLLTVNCNQQPLENGRVFVANLQTYTRPDQVQIVNKNYIKITYNWSPGTKGNRPLSNYWIDNLMPRDCKLYYSANGQGAMEIGKDNIKSLDTATSLISKPYLLIEFNNNDINLDQLLFDISFNSFSASFDESSKKIISLIGAFGATSTAANNIANTIDLSGLAGHEAFSSMKDLFKCRKIDSLILTNLNTSGVQNVSKLFYYSTINKSISGALANLNMGNVTNFSYSFSNSNLSDASFLSGWNTSKSISEISCARMFSGCEISDIKPVYTWLKNRLQYTTSTASFIYMFSGCKNLRDATGGSSSTEIFSDTLCNNKNINFGGLFKGCNLSNVPVIKITKALNVSFSTMFSECTISDFNNLRYWHLTTISDSSHLDFESMFKKTKMNNAITFGDGCDISKGTWDSRNMFKETFGNFSYTLTFNMFTGTASGQSSSRSISAFALKPGGSGGGIPDDNENAGGTPPSGGSTGGSTNVNEPREDVVGNMLDINNMNAGGIYYIMKKTGSAAGYPTRMYQYLKSIPEYKDYIAQGNIEEIRIIK